MVLSVATEKIPSDNTGNRSRDRQTSSAVPGYERERVSETTAKTCNNWTYFIL